MTPSPPNPHGTTAYHQQWSGSRPNAAADRTANPRVTGRFGPGPRRGSGTGGTATNMAALP
jgi:hypothetical protein